MSDREKQRTIAQGEFMKHEAEYSRLQRLVDTLISDMEYHSRQMETWNEYLGSLATPQPDLIIVAPPHSGRHLHIVPDVIA